MSTEDSPLNKPLPNYCPRCMAPLQPYGEHAGECIMRYAKGCKGHRDEHREFRSKDIPHSCRRPQSSSQQPPVSIQTMPHAGTTVPRDISIAAELERAVNDLDKTSTHQAMDGQSLTEEGSPISKRPPTDSGTYRITTTTLRHPAPPKKPESG